METIFAKLQATVLPSQVALHEVMTRGQQVRVQTVNLHHLYLARTDPNFLEALLAAERTTADGWPIRARLRSMGVDCERVTGSALVRDLVENASSAPLIGLIGTSEQTGRAFAALIEAGGGRVAYREHGRKEEWNPASLVAAAESAAVKLLLIAVTPPFGERLASAIRPEYSGSVVAVGGAVDMAVGATKGASPFLQSAGLEWLHRLAQEPRRLARRYLVDCLPTLAVDVLPGLLADIARRSYRGPPGRANWKS